MIVLLTDQLTYPQQWRKNFLIGHYGVAIKHCQIELIAEPGDDVIDVLKVSLRCSSLTSP
jgi:hypothetical protein